MIQVDLDVRVGAFSVTSRFEGAGVIALFGPSGCGKSLTIKAIAGLLDHGGTVALGGEALTGAPEARGVGYVPQHDSLFPFLDVAGNVAFSGADPGPWLERVGASHLRDRRVGSLSGGERQRVALARALSAEPRLLLLDEPFASMDRATAASMMATIAELGIPTLVVSHDEGLVGPRAQSRVRFSVRSDRAGLQSRGELDTGGVESP